MSQKCTSTTCASKTYDHIFHCIHFRAWEGGEEEGEKEEKEEEEEGGEELNAKSTTKYSFVSILVLLVMY